MSERKQNLYVPLRVRLRSPIERGQWEREQAAAQDMPTIPATPDDPLLQPAVTIPSSADLPQRARQIKELIRLGNMLRAELGLNEVLQQVVTSISGCTGFRISVLKLLEESSNTLLAVAFAGVSEEDKRYLQENHMHVEQMLKLMRPTFRISQSYFISHEHADVFEDIPVVGNMVAEHHEPGMWHPADMLMVPLYSPRKQTLLGFLSLDDPEDGKVPTEESIEMVELFANQAAIAIDNARIFQEQEAERLLLEKAIVSLQRDMERVRRGDLRVRFQTAHKRLQPVVEASNLMIEELNEIMGSMQKVTQAVDEHAQGVQRSSNVLVRDASQQERQVEHISRIVEEMAGTMKRVTERAEKIAQVTEEATEVAEEGQQKVDRANEGMRQVRETTLHSSRVIKRLGESGQEINDTIVELTELTTRMNLLALNAAIEAVRAGEQGQGFVVIAQEIRSLAVNSSEAARKIATRIRAIQNEMTTVSQSVEQNIQHVVMQTELVTQTGVALDAIGIVTEQMAGLAQGLGPAAESQFQSSSLVAHSVEEIALMASEIAQQSGEMKQSLAHLVSLTNSLRQRLSMFRIAERSQE